MLNALVVLQGGCSLQVVALRRWLLKQVGLYTHLDKLVNVNEMNCSNIPHPPLFNLFL